VSLREESGWGVMPQSTLHENVTAARVAAEVGQVSTPRNSGPGHVPSLDGLRTPAVVAVMLFHVGFPYARPLGALGVDLFFVLSGFLITTLLIREHERRGQIQLVRFWGRRFLRLMPAYYTYAAFITLAILVFGWGTTATARVNGWSVDDLVVSIWFYFVNYAPISGLWSNPNWIVHLWSLAVEEQFYLIWPPVLGFALKCKRGALIGWVLVAAIAINRVFYGDWERAHRLDARGLGIMLGCAVALSLRGSAASRARQVIGQSWVRFASIAGVVALGAITMMVGRVVGESHDLSLYTEPAFELCFAALVASLYHGPADPVSRSLSIRSVVYLGKISYGIYLYHMICQALVWDVKIAALDALPRGPRYLVRLAMFVGLSVGMASLSYHFLERPFLSLKERFR
jgi:peptidoglycan/LPS O-acetylase OafA/YrhL